MPLSGCKGMRLAVVNVEVVVVVGFVFACATLSTIVWAAPEPVRALWTALPA